MLRDRIVVDAASISVASRDQALWAVGSSPTGLTEHEAAARLERLGPNRLPEAPRRSQVRAFVDRITHFMALLLWAAGLLAFVAAMPELGVAIWAVVLINGALSFWQEHRAERALAEIARMLPVRARVLRAGNERAVPAETLVPGDVVILSEGEHVCADARLLSAHGLRLDLSMLTGESEPVLRTDEAPAAAVAAVEAPDLALAGSTVVAGHALGLVYATGLGTELGRVAALTARVRRERSTLEVQVARVVRVITAIAVGMGALVFALALAFVGMQPRESLLFAIGIVVANVPEGLLPTVTLALAMGVQRMARRNALVRRLSAIETLSATTVICTDKTGTLTTNHMTLRRIWVPDGLVSFGPAAPATDSEEARRQARRLLAAAALCSDARIEPGPTSGHGDATEQALARAAWDAGLRPGRGELEATHVRELPFDAWRRCMSMLVDDPGGGLRLLTKGSAPEVLARCSAIRHGEQAVPLGEPERDQTRQTIDTLAAEGHRVLAVAERALAPEQRTAPAAELEDRLTLLGLVALIDPPRPEAADAVARCRGAGIRVVMITGDHELTARAIGRTVGLCDEHSPVVSGRDLDGMDDAALSVLLASGRVSLFARVLPEQKLRVVEAFKSLGDVVAVTGDGVNDAPALRAAHIGIAMGRGGTDVAREAADVVLVDDDFATIVSAVEEGRAIYANIRKFMTYILTSNVPEIVPFLAMVALGVPPALTVLQILAVDLGTDLMPALALGAQPPEPHAMRAGPRKASARLLDGPLLARSYLFLGVIETIACMGAFFLVWHVHGVPFAELTAIRDALIDRRADPVTVAIWNESTTAALMAIVSCQVGNGLDCLSERASVLRTRLGKGALLPAGIVAEISLIAVILLVPPLAHVFDARVPPAPVWLWVAACPFVMLAAEEARKRLFRRQARATVAKSP